MPSCFSRLFTPTCTALSLSLALLAAVPTPARAQEGNRTLDFSAAATNRQQKRVALVIGNGYSGTTNQLQNTLNDARDMAAALQALGFDVLKVEDADQKTMLAAIRTFGNRLEISKGVGLFYFAGHGLQVEGRNYLVPSGFKAENAAEAADEGVDAQKVLRAMESSGSPLNIVILDACRNNPFINTGKRGLGDQGLSRMDAPAGTLIAYATAPGQTASDNQGSKNGLYTQELLKQIRTPGLRIEDVFKNTRVAVKTASGAKQVPWEESSLESDFRFLGSGEAAIADAETKVVNTLSRLRITVNVPNASVVVDGQAVAAGQEFVANLLDEERKVVQVKVSAPGHLGQLQEVTLVRGRIVPLSVTLAPAPVAPPPVDPAPDASANIPEVQRPNSPAYRAQPEYQRAIKAYSDKDYATAARLLPKFALQGDAEAQNILGFMYEKGYGVTKDEAEAVAWYRKSAIQGYVQAQNNTGIMYYNGKGVKEDNAEALRWFRKAADQGHPVAQFFLGEIYEKGYGVTIDKAEAVRWYRKSAEQGDEDATKALTRLGY